MSRSGRGTTCKNTRRKRALEYWEKALKDPDGHIKRNRYEDRSEKTRLLTKDDLVKYATTQIESIKRNLYGTVASSNPTL